jgi:hypothetical protein
MGTKVRNKEFKDTDVNIYSFIPSLLTSNLHSMILNFTQAKYPVIIDPFEYRFCSYIHSDMQIACVNLGSFAIEA